MLHPDKNKYPLGAHLYKEGVVFRVWAPFAENVFVTGSFNNWTHTPMTNEGNGYWQAEVNGAEAGQEYKFVIKNGDRELYRNDPRALQVTTSSGGTSIIVDPSFDWEQDSFTAPPLNEQVVYELHVGTFSRPDPATVGTFDDVVAKLDYLKDLGINMIELMPINSMTTDRGWGYATDYIYAIETLYGGRQGFLNFVKTAHQRGIGVILDVVYNHFGPDPSGLDLWQFDGWSENGKGGIYFYNDERSSTPWGETRPDFGRSEVQDYILDSVALWMAGCHVDGLRVDSTIYIRNLMGFNNDPEHDIPDGWHILQRITDLARKINPNAILIAEDTAANDFITKATDQGGAGFTAQWELGFPNSIRDLLAPDKDEQRNIGGICDQLTHRRNDNAFERIIYSESHDSAANGSARLSELISPDKPLSLAARKRGLLAATLVLTAPGIPMLFQGQEFNQGGSFNDWQGLDWENAKKYPGFIVAHQHLVALRKNLHGNTKGLTGQNISILHTDWENKVIAYHRWDHGGPKDDAVILLNFSSHTLHNYQLPFPSHGEWIVRFNSSWRGYSPDFKEVKIDKAIINSDRSGEVKLAPYSALILSLE